RSPLDGWGLERTIIHPGKLVYNETTSALKADRSGIHVAAVDRQRLAGHEVALRRSEEDERPEQILGMLVAPQRSRLHRALARGLHMAGIFAQHGVAQGEARRQRVDADSVLSEFGRLAGTVSPPRAG